MGKKNISVRDFIYTTLKLRDVPTEDAKAIANFLAQWLVVKDELKDEE